MSTRVKLDPSKKRYLVKFHLDELSAVDAPANEMASAVLQKRAEPTPSEEIEFRKTYSHPIQPIRRTLSKVESNLINSGRGRDVDPDTAKVLDAKTVPLTFKESEFYNTLEGDERRRFLLSSHDERSEIMKFAATKDEAVGYDTFEEAVTRIQKEEDISRLDAMRIARSRDPALLEKVRFGSSSDAYSDGEDIAKARKAGRQKQALIDDAVAKRMKAGQTDRLEALRDVHRTNPELFAD